MEVRSTRRAWRGEVHAAALPAGLQRVIIPVHLKEESPQDVVGMGDLGYWPPGNAFCIFFGPTPASRGDEIRPASPVNVFGRVVGDPKVFKKVRAGTAVRIEEV